MVQMRKDEAGVGDVDLETRGEGRERESGSKHNLGTEGLWKEGGGFSFEDRGATGTLSSLGPREGRTGRLTPGS